MASQPRIRPRLLLSLIVILVSLTPAKPEFSVPPLQWLNLTNLLHGSSPPPPLKNALIGYDETSRSVVIFGGESSSGLVQSQTYLLNLDTLTWSLPSPPPGLQRAPPARSSAVAGADFAASNRHGFVLIGGKGADGKPLDDVWEYDFLYQFWSQVKLSPGGPSPRFSMAGGKDFSAPPIQDPILPGPNNSFYIAGGSNGVQSLPFSDLWRLNISGTLSPNLPDDANGSWERLSVPNLSPTYNQASTVISNKIILTSGFNETQPTDDCPQQTSYIIDTELGTQVSPTICPAPRTGPVLVANPSRFTSAYSSQVFLLLGTVNTSRWDVGLSPVQGEVAILDINTGTWSRIIPAGDPGFSGIQKFPSPREGAAAFSYPQALVGPARTAAADTLVFGGQDAFGNVLSEVWLLRAYNATVTSSNPTWFGFGQGQLQTGVDASGTGVRVRFLQDCPMQLDSPQNPSPLIPQVVSRSYDTANTHKIFAPVSLALMQFMLIFIRLGSLSYAFQWCSCASLICAAASYTLGVAGLATAFSTISVARASVNGIRHLRTMHGLASLLCFLLLYGVLVPLLLIPFSRKLARDGNAAKSQQQRTIDTPEDSSGNASDSPPSGSNQNFIPPASPPRRIHSWGPSGLMRSPREGHSKSDRDSVRSAVVSTSTPAPRTFEVLNRPAARTRKASGQSVPPFGTTPDELATSLQQVDWLQRRRSLNVVGELDYAITQARKELRLSTTATADGNMSSAAPNTSRLLSFPPSLVFVVHFLTHAVVLVLSVFTLIMLKFRAPLFAFVLFLAWTVAFYVILVVLAVYGSTAGPVRGVFRSRFMLSSPDELPSPALPRPSAAQDPAVGQGPYVHHQPLYRVVSNGSQSHPQGQRSVESSDDDGDDNMDDDTRQRVIEEEMGRREVSIITIPRRKLLVANPS